MRTLSGSAIVLRILGLLLLTAAVLKGHELLTTPVAHQGLGSWRPFLIFQVEFELGLGIWLLSGTCKQLAWLISLLCFGLFCCVTLYKSLTGAVSCGCFGQVHISPWVVLATIDVPAVVLLLVWRPVGTFTDLAHPALVSLRAPLLPWQGCRHLWRGGERTLAWRSRLGIPPRPVLTSAGAAELAFTSIVILLVLGLSTPILALTKPPKTTNRYAVLEPQTWVGKPLPILPYIDIADALTKDRWLVVLYHHACRRCAKIIPQFEQLRRELTESDAGPVCMALIEVPPYDPHPGGSGGGTMAGRLSQAKTWFLTTPTVLCLTDGRVVFAEDGAPDLQAISNVLGQPGESPETPEGR
jgi:hypothetical protein